MDYLSLVYAKYSVFTFNLFFAVSKYFSIKFCVGFCSVHLCKLCYHFQLTGSITLAISSIIFAQYQRYEFLIGKYDIRLGSWTNLNWNFFSLFYWILGDHFWWAAFFLICAGLCVFLIATLCSCGAIKENSHIILTVRQTIKQNICEELALKWLPVKFFI